MIRRRFARALRWLANELDPAKAEPLPRSWIINHSTGATGASTVTSGWISGAD